MSNLRDDHPAVYRDFVSGFHVVRRSDRFWAGLSTDLVIEQVLMRSLKTSGGLTRGRGFTEQQRLIWLLSMPACADTNRAMQELTGVKSNSGEQNKDMTKARQKRDAKDTLAILTTFAETATETSSCRCLMEKAVIQCHVRARRRCSACIGRWSSTPSNSMASRVRNLSRYLWIIL